MTGPSTSIYRCERPLLIPGIRATYSARPGRAHQGRSDIIVTRPADSFLGRATRIWTYWRNYCAICYCKAVCESPDYSFSLEK